MLAVYITLLACTMMPVILMQAGAQPVVLMWLVYALILVKSLLLVDYFMEMKHAPLRWRLATQSWALVVTLAVAGIHAIG